MNSNITNSNITLNTPTADTFAFWFNNLPTNIISQLFGHSQTAILRAAKDFQLVSPVDMQQSLLEIPLQGNPYTDISFSYSMKNLVNNFFNSIGGQKVLPLFQYLGMLLPKDNSVYVELDTGNSKQEIPSVFFDCTNSEKIIFSKLWAKNNEPPQWFKAEEIVNNLPQDWQLLYLGLMPGRTNSPLKMIFTRNFVNDEHLPCTLQDIENLLAAIHHSPLPADAKTKIPCLTDLNYPEITVSLNLLPDGNFDSRLGMEVFLPEEAVNPEQTLTTQRGLDLLSTLKKWQVADSRADLLPQCCGIFFPPQALNEAESQVQVFLNHIKLQWNEGKALPAKAYIACNSYFR